MRPPSRPVLGGRGGCPHPPLAAREVAARRFPLLVPECLTALSNNPAGEASPCTLLAKKAHVVGSQILWERQGAELLSCPENNLGA